MFRFLVRSKSFACIYIFTLLFIIFFKTLIKKLIVLFTKNISDWQQPTLLLHCFSRNFRAISERVTVTIISSPSYDGHMFHKIWDKYWFGLRQIWETLSDDFNILLVKFRGNDQGPKIDRKSWKVLTQSLVGLLQISLVECCKTARCIDDANIRNLYNEYCNTLEVRFLLGASTSPSDKRRDVSTDSDILDLISSPDLITSLSITAEISCFLFFSRSGNSSIG